MKTTRRVRAASLLAVAALGLSACGTVEDLTGGEDETSSEQEQQQEGDGNEGDGEETDDGETDGQEIDGGTTSLTAPGTQLKVGDKATVPQGDEGGTVQVTVSKITEGSFADLAHLEDADEYAGYTPYYVEYTITGTDSSSVLEYSLLDDVHPITSDGNRAGSLVVLGTFDKCDPNSFPKGFGPGDTVTDCDIAMLSEGQELGGAMFQQFEGDYTDANRIVWEE